MIGSLGPTEQGCFQGGRESGPRAAGCGLAAATWLGGAAPPEAWASSNSRARLSLFRTAGIQVGGGLRRRAESGRNAPSIEDSLPCIERAMNGLCRGRAFGVEEREEFRAWAWVKLLERWDRIVAEFGGRARFDGYLRRVLVNLLKDYRTAKWGKWRPSSVAADEGLEAMELERLTCAERLEPSEAVERLVHERRCSAESEQHLRERLWELMARLPARESSQTVAYEPERLESLPDPRVEGAADGSVAVAGDEPDRQWLAMLVHALGQIDESGLQLLESYFVHQRPYVETARRTGRVTTEVYNEAHRALRRMKRILVRQLADRGPGSSSPAGVALDQALAGVDLGVGLRSVFCAARSEEGRAWAATQLAES